MSDVTIFSFVLIQEVEEKAPLLMQQKEDYQHAKKIIENMAVKLEENIKVIFFFLVQLAFFYFLLWILSSSKPHG